MSQPEEPRHDTLEAWLDGALFADERARFEARLRDDEDLAGQLELQRAIDASLQRSFATPSPNLDALLERAGAVRPAPPRPFRVLRSFLGVLVAAAIVFAFVRLAGLQSAGETELATGDVPLEVASLDVPLVVPLVVPSGGGRETASVDSPNLVRLYLDAAGQEADSSQCNGPDDLSVLARELESRYGSDLSLTPEASGVLHGPFDSQEWPSGTVLTSYPDGPLGQPVVLVAEQESQLACCIDMSLPQSSELQMFTWKVGSLLLTEITPHREPRLISCFEPDS